MESLEVEGKPTYKNPQNIDNRGNFRRPNNIASQIMPRDPRSRDKDDQKIQTPLQNNLFVDEEGEEEELDPEIHCLGDTSPFPHLTQSAYEESLLDSQINELRKGEKANSSPNKYNRGSKKKEVKSNIHDHPSIVEKPTKDATNNIKEEKAQNPPPIAKDLVPEVREIMKPPSSFSFENEIYKIGIPIPLS
jgi:hypothetical protein